MYRKDRGGKDKEKVYSELNVRLDTEGVFIAALCCALQGIIILLL